MRNSVIGTPDGAAEYQKVILEPANWLVSLLSVVRP
jgi:hypothetical protein